MKKIRELLAALCHIQWSGWMKYQFSQGTFNDDGTWTMPAWAVERRTKLMNMVYSEMPESEKDKDREEADKFIELWFREYENAEFQKISEKVRHSIALVKLWRRGQ